METRLAELYITNARDRALRLLCTASTIIPEEFVPQITEQVTVDLTEFALHARRVNELCELPVKTFGNVSNSRYDVTGYPKPVETNYGNALNRIIHARSYAVGYSVWTGDKIFLASAINLIPTYVQIETDNPKYGAACVNIFGVAFCFLTEAILHIKEKHPTLKF